jgi:hypothetical protein
MTTNFKTLFVITITHAYYRERCEDVAFVIPADTIEWLKNGKLLGRELDGKLHVLYETDDDELAPTALKPVPGQTLRIGLRLINPLFSNFTKLENTFASTTFLYRNATAPTALDAPAKVQLVGHVFSHPLSDGARPVTATLKNKAGAIVQTEEVTAALNRPAVSYDLSGLAPGPYLVEENYQAGTVQTSYYSDPELVQAGIFGIVEVQIDNGFYSAVAPPKFEIAFNAREETLRYYVVATNYPTAQLSVSDVGAIEDGRPAIIFDKIASGDLSDPEKLSRDLLKSGSAEVVLFRSHDDVTRAEKPRKKIQLKKNGDVLITHLPQPRPENPNADLIISVSKP